MEQSVCTSVGNGSTNLHSNDSISDITLLARCSSCLDVIFSGAGRDGSRRGLVGTIFSGSRIGSVSSESVIRQF